VKISSRNLLPLLLCSVLSLQALSISAHAETGSGDKWTFQLAPYAWLAGQDGQVGTFPGLPPADIDINFYDDVFGNINGAIMLVGEARKGKFGMVMDIAYTNIEFDESTPGQFFSSVVSTTKSWIVSAAGFYRVIEKDRTFLDAMGGIRYWSIDSELYLNGGLASARGISNKEDWVDPIIGLKGLMPLGESKFFVSGFFLIGGFGVGSDFMWDANANVGYQWTDAIATTIGYRYLDVDYEKDGFLYDVAQDGLVLGLSWRF
jgi:hypothetical protein